MMAEKRPAVFVAGMIVTAILIFSGSADAQGTTGYEILRLQTQPRGSSLAGALVADEGHIESTFYNPAGLAALSQRVASAGYMNYLLDIQSGHMEYADATQPWGTWGVMISYTNYGDFEGRSTTGVELPSFTAADVVLGASYARRLKDRINVGGSFKFVQSNIEDYTGRALALDIGGQYTLIPEQLRLGVGIYNLGGTVKAYDTYKDDLPLYYRIGIWGIPRGLPASLFFSMTMYQEYADNYSLGSISGADLVDFLKDFYIGFGAEFHPIEQFHLRVGYNSIGLDQQVGSKKDFLAGICFGVGFDMTVMRMDYGLASYGELGMVQRISLSKSF